MTDPQIESDDTGLDNTDLDDTGPAPRPVRDISGRPVRDPAAFPGAAIGGGLLGVVLLVGCGLLIRDLLAVAGVISGDTWVHQSAVYLGGQTWGTWTWAVPAISLLVALTALWLAVKPRRHTHRNLTDYPVVWTRPVDVARRVSAAVSDLPDVRRAVTSVGRRRITVVVTATGAVDVDRARQTARAAAGSAADGAKTVVKVRRETDS